MEERNVRPKEGSNLPAVTLAVLVLVVLALLYIGYTYFTDNSASTLTPVRTSQAAKEAVTPPADEPITASETQPEPLSAPVIEPPKPAETTTEAQTPLSEPETPVKETAVAEAPSKSESITHEVADGQTFYSIARKYGVSADKLKAANPGVATEAIKTGNSLKIPVYKIHTVGKGDILRVVAEKYGVSVDALMKANGKAKNIATRGEKLIIPFPQ